MHVYCWNLYDGWAGEIVGDVANSVESGDTLVNFYFKPLWGGARAHNFIGIYVEGVTEGYGLLYSRVDTVREIETEECGWLCIASLFVPEYARQISVNITFLYMAYYWFYSFETGGGTVYSNAHWDIDLVIFQYRPADAEWHIIINEWLPPADLSAAVSNYIPPYYFDPETGQLTTGFYIFRDKGRFSYALEIPEGPCWLGVRFWLETSLEAFSCDEDTYGNAKAVTHLDVTDLTISVSFVKRAFEQAEMGYVDPANHTIVVGPDTPVNHTIRYGVAYSHTWDAFRFTIYVPDYADSLVSPVYETNHEDGLITGIFNTTSPNYVERLSAYIWRKDAKMLTIAYIRRSDGGRAMLDLYEPDNSIASAYNWTVNDYAEEIFVEEWVECLVPVQVVDEYGNPVAGATVEVYAANGELVASGETGDSGYVSFILPHQGRYYFHAYYEDRHGFRDSTVLPLMTFALVGPFPDLSEWGYLEAGFKRTGYPMGPPYNFVKIVLETEATLYVGAMGLLPPWPYRLTWVHVNVTVYDEEGNVVAAGVTPFDASLSTGTYHVTVPENTTVKDYELRFAFWILVDSPPTNRTATVNLLMDRRIYAVYAYGSILNVSSLLAYVLEPFGDAFVAVLDPGSTTPIYTAFGLVEVPRIMWTGVTPCMAILPPGEYIVVAHQHEPENYTVVGWEGVDEDLGAIQVPFLDVVFVGARVNLAQDRDISCLHELELGKDPLLIVRSKFVDGSEFRGLPLTITKLAYPTGGEYYVEARTPYEDYVEPSYYALEVPAS
ncbi:MAG: hypothetical protein DRJ56_08475, partial [Thermoprotei archaeon]